MWGKVRGAKHPAIRKVSKFTETRPISNSMIHWSSFHASQNIHSYGLDEFE